MAQIRPAAIAGQFYEGNPERLSASVARFMAGAAAADAAVAAPKAVIAPHAGHVYSGACAAEAYARLLPDAERIERIILLGPCHRVAVRGLATTSAEFWETPLGRVAIDRDAYRAVSDLPKVIESDAAHAQEHSLEVHLPFLQHCLKPDFKLVPFAVGQATNEEVAAVLDRLWGGPETRIVVSTDLSHFLDYDTARALDAKTAEAIETLDWQSVGRDQACGRVPMSGLLTLAKRRGMAIERVGLVNSGDTAGGKDRVVGYGAWVLEDGETEEPATAAGPADPDAMVAKQYGPFLLDIVKQTLGHSLQTGKPPNVNTNTFPDLLRNVRGTFVTIERHGKLRGCIGTLEPHQPLIDDLVANAYKAGFKDPRFPPLNKGDADGLTWSISILTPKQAMTFEDEADLLAQLEPGIDGLIIQDGARRSTFLPQVWDQIPDRRDFLGRLKQKAGLRPDHWSDSFQVWRYRVTKIE